MLVYLRRSGPPAPWLDVGPERFCREGLRWLPPPETIYHLGRTTGSRVGLPSITYLTIAPPAYYTGTPPPLVECLAPPAPPLQERDPRDWEAYLPLADGWGGAFAVGAPARVAPSYEERAVVLIGTGARLVLESEGFSDEVRMTRGMRFTDERLLDWWLAAGYVYKMRGPIEALLAGSVSHQDLLQSLRLAEELYDVVHYRLNAKSGWGWPANWLRALPPVWRQKLVVRALGLPPELLMGDRPTSGRGAAVYLVAAP